MKTKTFIKNFIFISCISVFALLAAVLLSACGEHKHKFSNWQIKAEANCTEAGLRERVCADCGEVESEVLPALGHNWHVDNVTKQATCLEPGLETTHCLRCGEVNNEVEIKPLGHLWSEEIHGEGMGHYHLCTREGDEDYKSALDFERSTELSCMVNEADFYKCAICQYEYENVHTAAPMHHDYAQANYVELSASTHALVCDKCGEYGEAESCDFSRDQQTIDPTCEKPGYDYALCVHCNNEQTSNPKPALTHDYGDEYEPFTKYENGEIKYYHRQTCIREDCKKEEHYIVETECSFKLTTVKPTCDYTKDDPVTTGQGYDEHKCEVCNFVYKDNYKARLEHNWDGWQHNDADGQDTHTRHCLNNCGHDETETCEIVETKHTASCYRNAYTHRQCFTCGYDEEREDEHTKREHQLTYEEIITDGESDHEYHFAKCSYDDCDYAENLKHDLSSSKTTPATCTMPEYTTMICANCTHTHDDQTADALGHDFKVWTLKDERYHTSTCDRQCGVTVEEEHNFNNSNICICGLDDLVYEDIDDSTCYVKGFGAHSSYSKNVVVNDKHAGKTVVGIGNSAFAPVGGKANMQTFTYVGSGLEYVGELAFVGQKYLTEVNFADGLKRIEAWAFYYCPALATVNLPASVTKIDGSAFTLSGMFENAQTATEDATYLTLTTGDVTKYYLIGVKNSVSGQFEIKAGTFGVGGRAFSNCAGITGLIMPKEISYIGIDAFEGCTGLAAEGGFVEYKGGIGEWLGVKFGSETSSPTHFANIFHVEITEDEENLDLTKYKDRTIEQIPAGTFRDDYDHVGGFKLKSIIIPDTVTFIGANAFKGCTALTSVTILSTKITYIGENAFLDTGIYNNWKNEVENKKPALYLGQNNEYLIAVDEAMLTLTDDGKTYDEIKETGVFILNDRVKVIADDAFKGFTSLTAITINPFVQAGDEPSGSQLVTIGENAFNGCTNLTTIYIPSQIQFIGAGAFVGSGLKTATFQNTQIVFWADSGNIARAPKLDNDVENAKNLLYAYTGQWTRK